MTCCLPGADATRAHARSARESTGGTTAGGGSTTRGGWRGPRARAVLSFSEMCTASKSAMTGPILATQAARRERTLALA
eukprot:5530070-Pyramimonas_sp.AAC.1